MTGKTLTSMTINGQPIEWVASAGAFAGYTFDVVTNGANQFCYTNATGNGTVNFRASSGATLDSFMGSNTSITCNLLITNGSTAYYPTAYQIDGSAVTVKWAGTAPSSGNTSAIDAYTFTIIKTASATYTVLATRSRFA